MAQKYPDFYAKCNVCLTFVVIPRLNGLIIGSFGFCNLLLEYDEIELFNGYFEISNFVTFMLIILF